jgi:hypothetical protein
LEERTDADGIAIYGAFERFVPAHPSHCVEVAKDLPRLRALAGTDVTPLLENIEDAGGASITEAQAALEK